MFDALPHAARVAFFGIGGLSLLILALRTMFAADAARKKRAPFVFPRFTGIAIRGRQSHWAAGYAYGVVALVGALFLLRQANSQRPDFDFVAPAGWTNMSHGSNVDQLPKEGRANVRATVSHVLFLAVDTRHPERGYPFIVGSATRGTDFSDAAVRRMTTEAYANELHVDGRITSVEQREVDGRHFARLDHIAGGSRMLTYYFPKGSWLGILSCSPDSQATGR